MSLVRDPQRIRLAMLGMVDGNGHPYSWSAIINGHYDAAAMAQCGYPTIPQYLGAASKDALGIPGAEVTHVWCDDPADAARVARAACIANVAARPEDVIGQVDAAIIATDKGFEHVDRARPFIEAGLPVFVDKPLVDRAEDLAQFVRWQRAGRPILSTSCMRYAREFVAIRNRLRELGQLRLATITTAKSWERYGIHALEAVYPLLRPGGWLSVANTGNVEANIVHARHADGIDVVLAAVSDLYGAFGCLGLYGTKTSLTERFQDTFYAFKTQLVAFVEYLRTGTLPFPFEQTIELMKIIIAGIRSREQGGRTVMLEEIQIP
jgi:predicted dehydrogenase